MKPAEQMASNASLLNHTKPTANAVHSTSVPMPAAAAAAASTHRVPPASPLMPVAAAAAGSSSAAGSAAPKPVPSQRTVLKYTDLVVHIAIDSAQIDGVSDMKPAEQVVSNALLLNHTQPNANAVPSAAVPVSVAAAAASTSAVPFASAPMPVAVAAVAAVSSSSSSAAPTAKKDASVAKPSILDPIYPPLPSSLLSSAAVAMDLDLATDKTDKTDKTAAAASSSSATSKSKKAAVNKAEEMRYQAVAKHILQGSMEPIRKAFEGEGLLINRADKKNPQMTPLMLACKAGFLDVIYYFLTGDVEVPDPDTEVVYNQNNFSALKVEKGNPAAMDVNDFTPLMHFLGNVETFQQEPSEKFLKVLDCLLVGVEINRPAKDGVTHLMVAALKHALVVVQRLLAKGAKSSIDAQNKSGDNAIMWATNERRLDTIQLLASPEFGANLHSRNRKGENALFLAAKHGYPEIIDYLRIQKVDCKGEVEGKKGRKNNILTYIIRSQGLNIAEKINYIVSFMKEGVRLSAEDYEVLKKNNWSEEHTQEIFAQYVIQQRKAAENDSPIDLTSENENATPVAATPGYPAAAAAASSASSSLSADPSVKTESSALAAPGYAVAAAATSSASAGSSLNVDPNVKTENSALLAARAAQALILASLGSNPSAQSRPDLLAADPAESYIAKLKQMIPQSLEAFESLKEKTAKLTEKTLQETRNRIALLTQQNAEKRREAERRRKEEEDRRKKEEDERQKAYLQKTLDDAAEIEKLKAEELALQAEADALAVLEAQPQPKALMFTSAAIAAAGPSTNAAIAAAAASSPIQSATAASVDKPGNKRKRAEESAVTAGSADPANAGRAAAVVASASAAPVRTKPQAAVHTQQNGVANPVSQSEQTPGSTHIKKKRKIIK
jgi:ankyrin repeat protein